MRAPVPAVGSTRPVPTTTPAPYVCPKRRPHPHEAKQQPPSPWQPYEWRDQPGCLLLAVYPSRHQPTDTRPCAPESTTCAS
jgi:hypothetical protein